LKNRGWLALLKLTYFHIATYMAKYLSPAQRGWRLLALTLTQKRTFQCRILATVKSFNA
jgi:hypothetical protein